MIKKNEIDTIYMCLKHCVGEYYHTGIINHIDVTIAEGILGDRKLDHLNKQEPKECKHEWVKECIYRKVETCWKCREIRIPTNYPKPAEVSIEELEQILSCLILNRKWDIDKIAQAILDKYEVRRK